MDLASILSPQRTRCGLQSTSKKRSLEDISHLINDADTTLGSDVLFTSFTAREKLGSTALGQGIAIPHCRLSRCSRITGALVTLTNPVDFEAMDGQLVDILFALVVPEQADQQHLDVLAALATLFTQSEFCQYLRSANSDQELYDRTISYV